MILNAKKAIVIGAGIGGIATAIRLAVKGFSVEVFEANSYPGGKLSEIKQGGYRFDAGPSLFTMPHYVDELFLLAGKKPEAHFKYKKMKENCRYFFPDGTRWVVGEGGIRCQVSGQKSNIPSSQTLNLEPQTSNLKPYYKNSRRIWNITSHVFLERSLHRLGTYLRWKTMQSILRLFQIDAFRSMHKANKAFFADEKWVQFADRFATYNGSNPYEAPATLNVIPHLEHEYGTWFPEGGMYNISLKLVELAESLGVKFHYSCGVDEIVVKDNKVEGVKVKGALQKADVVVSNCDVWFTYKKLLQNERHFWPKRILEQERSSSALIFYWGIKKQFPELGLHNIFFSADYKAEFDAIWKEKTISNDPTVYLNISSKIETADAPESCENWFVMINVPANNGQDWDTLIALARRNILEKLERELGLKVENLIETESVLDPRSIESTTSSYQGSLYGNSSNNRFAAFLRHANRSSKLKNLYFCGGSVHPGGGIPLSLLSAKIVADWVK